MATTPSNFQVLFVCTGNICRSPLAEQVFEDLSAKSNLPLNFDSAGVYAEVGDDMHPQSQQAMREANLSPKPHVAKQLSSQIITRSDLILTATADHSLSVARMNPASSQKIFTLKEFARIAQFFSENSEQYEAKSIQDKLELARRYRGFAPPATSVEDIIDPWGRSYESYQAVTAETALLAEKIVNWLGAK